MLDIKEIRKDPEKFKNSLKRKGIDPKKIDELLNLDEKKLNLLQKIEDASARQNEVSKLIPSLKGKEKESLLAEMKIISKNKKEKDLFFQEIRKSFNKGLYNLPNTPLDSVPEGKGEEGNKVIRKEGKPPKFDFKPKEHWELAEELNLLDTERSAKVSGSRFYYLKNELALLQQALIFWAFTEVSKKGFSPMIPPFLTKERAIRGTGYFSHDENYRLDLGKDEESLFLIGTSEVPMISFYDNEIIEEKDLPQKFVSYSPCFRREAGSYGKDTKGIFRVHQFEKVEMVVFCLPEQGEKMHEEILKVEEYLMKQLGLHYQVVNVCCGDLGISAAKKYDLEAWLPGQNRYREMTSTSNCTDYQTRNLDVRIRRKNGEIVTAHTINGTAVSSRPLIAILENFQRKDGSVDIPKVLQPLCGFKRIEVK